jgi:Zn-dependent peptidase ImmA (M78 family)
MTTELLMDLADCRFPEQLHNVIFRHHPQWTLPVPVDELAHTVNITEIRELDDDSFEGALVTNPNKTQGVILYKAGVREERRRFTVAHELGHFLIPSHSGNRNCTASDLRELRRDSDHRRREAEANRFAAGLLMPRDWFSRDLDQLGDADVTHVQTLAKKYRTSLEATSNRYIDLTPDACAFVFSKEGIIRYVRPTANFPRLSVKYGNSLPSGSASLRAKSQPVRIPTSWSEIDGSVWLENDREKRFPKVLEQTVRQSNGFQITLLFIDEEAIEQEDEEAELEENWAIRFPRR